jgi:hypothetical protein
MYNNVKRGRRRLGSFRDECQVMMRCWEGEVREEGQAAGVKREERSDDRTK